MPEKFTEKVTREYLDRFYKSDNGFGWAKETISGYTEFASIRKFKVIVDIISSINPDNILDIGCGGGLFISELQKHGYKIIGIDISYNLLSKIRENKILVCGRSELLPFKDNSFNLVLCTEVLEHIFDLDKALNEIKRIVKNNGYVIITVPNLHCYDGIEGATGIITKTINVINYIRKIAGKDEIYKFGWNTHLHKHPPNKWKKIFKDNGLKVETSFPIFISPYIPSIFIFCKKIENFLYTKKVIFNLQYAFERLLRKIFPFNYLGQLHLFVLRKL